MTLPPDFFLYETFDLNYEKYYHGGIDTARWIVKHLENFSSIENKVILDWGCGPGRIIRHLPNLLNSNNRFYGSDYNSDYVDWCHKNLHNIRFIKNSLNPPLDFENQFFDIVYSISIFTHLSEKMHHEWMKELSRITKENALLFITTHGDNFIKKLTKQEQKDFASGKLIEHQYKIEGNRLYASYQPTSFFKSLVLKNNFEILLHDQRKSRSSKLNQDVWILRKT